MHTGNYIYEWLTPLLEDVGVRTFADQRCGCRGTTGSGGRCGWVDGGVLNNFPITVFDRTDGKAPALAHVRGHAG